MDTAISADGEEYMTNQQFDAVIKMVLHLIDANEADPKTARKMILDLLIDEKSRNDFEKPMSKRKPKHSEV